MGKDVLQTLSEAKRSYCEKQISGAAQLESQANKQRGQFQQRLGTDENRLMASHYHEQYKDLNLAQGQHPTRLSAAELKAKVLGLRDSHIVFGCELPVLQSTMQASFDHKEAKLAPRKETFFQASHFALGNHS